MPAEPPQPPVPLAEIAQGPSAFEMFLERNQKNLVILAILLVLATAVLVVYRGIEKGAQQSAGNDLNKADDLASLQAVINDHPDTKAALSAKVLLAERQWTEGQQDTALDTLRKFIATSSDHPAQPTAQASLASKLMSQGKNPEAAEIFQNLVGDPKARHIAPYALICLGDMAQLAGDLEKAEASYTRIKTDFADSSFAETATRRVASLKAKPPVEIDPPPAPDPAPAGDTPATPPGFSIQPPPGAGITVTPEVQPEPVPTPTPVQETTPAPDAPVETAPPADPPQETPAGTRSEEPAAETPAGENTPAEKP